MNKPLNYLFIFCLLVIFLTPLIYDLSGFYGYVVPKALLFQVATLVGGIVFLINRNETSLISYNPLSVSITCFLFLCLLFNLLSYDTLFSIGATFERMEGAVNTIILIIFFFLLVALFKAEEKQKLVFLFMLIVSTTVAVFGVLSGKEVGKRLISTIGNPAFLCFYLANHLFLLAVFYLKYKPRYIWLFVLNSILLLYIIVQTLTRTFYIAMAVSVLVMALVYIFNKISKEVRLKAIAGLTLTLALLIIAFYGILEIDWVYKRLPINRLKDLSSLDARFLVWGIAAKGFFNNWFLGWGQENFSYVYTQFFNPAVAGEGIWYDRAHNVFLDWFVAGGILGGISYISIWASAIYCVWKSDLLLSLKILLIGWIVFYCCFIFFNPDSLVNSIFSVVILSFIYHHSFKQTRKFSFLAKHYMLINLFFVGIFSTILYQFTYNNIRAYRIFSKALTQPSIQSLIDLSGKAYNIRSAINLNMIEQLTVMQRSVLGSDLSFEQKQFYNLTIKQLIEKEIKRHPPSVKLLELKSMIELNMGDIEAGNKTLENILRLSPQYIVAYIQKSKIAQAQHRYDEALLYLNKVIALAPDNIQARISRLTLYGLQNPDYDIAAELNTFSKTDLDINITKIKEVFLTLNRPQDFVYWIRGGGLFGINISKQAYFEWIMTAMQINDLKSVQDILQVYQVNHPCDSPLLTKVWQEVQAGTPPTQTLKELFLACP